MRKTVSPAVAIAVLVIVLVVVGYFFAKKVKGPKKVIMTPQGAIDAETGKLMGPSGGQGRRGGRQAGGQEEGGRRGRR
ncbi:MAG: hypothetical protein JSV79_05630 [Armatimonadota bacterium]|nr:MAG: hypothetical protein JSV79_05630 [Armatimonadota bacterium]